jgi:hypothetical protein
VTHWADANQMEMAVILPAVRVVGPGVKPTNRYKITPCHNIYDVESDFSRKPRFGGGGHVTKPP